MAAGDGDAGDALLLVTPYIGFEVTAAVEAGLDVAVDDRDIPFPTGRTGPVNALTIESGANALSLFITENCHAATLLHCNLVRHGAQPATPQVYVINPPPIGRHGARQPSPRMYLSRGSAASRTPRRY